MRRFAAMMGLYLIILLYLFVTLENVACRFDKSGLPASPAPTPDNYQNCTAKMKACDKKQEQVKVTVSGPGPYNIGGTYQVDDFFQVNDRLYINQDQPWVAQEIQVPALRGGILIRTDHNHRGVKEGRFLDLHFPGFDHIKDLYVAYDSRANPKPQWLANKQNWERMWSINVDYVVTSMPDKSAPTLKPVQLEVYRLLNKPKAPPPGQPTFSLPGNNCSLPDPPPSTGCTGTPAWPGVSDKNRAMYIVIITRKDLPECSKGWVDEQNKYEGCKPDEASAKKEATDKCNQMAQSFAASTGLNPAFFQCLPPTCGQVTVCPKKSGLIQNRSYPISSVVEFNPSKHKSEAMIKVKGKKFTQKVEGKLYFEYLLDEFDAMKNMRIDGMNLDIEPVNSDAGNFTNIVVMLRETARASCQDASPPYAGNKPCDKYRVPTGGFKAFLSTREGGKTLLFDPVNRGNVDIQIDHNNRTFQIKGGPLSASVQVNGKSVPLDIDIDLFGHFLNFAPHAVGGKESTKWVECRWSDNNNLRSNRDPIILNSAGSFETYNDTIPQNAYEWFEDYTWPPQKKWGTGSTYTIKPHDMSFGVHEMTLLIRDAFGISDLDTFDVAVRDTQPPKITVPSDVQRLVIPPDRPPVKAYIGQASATDECFGKDVVITNDAPQDSRFPEGVTPVNWTAEDGAGNTATGTQKVTVYRVVDKRDPKVLGPKIKQWIAYTAEEIHQSQAAANRCDELELRTINPRAQADLTKQMADLIEGLPPRPERMERRARTVQLLRQSEAQLGEADRLIERARTAERAGARRDFCTAAATSLGDAGTGIAGVLAPPEPPGEPPPSGAVAPIEPPPFEPVPPGGEVQDRCREYAQVAVALSQESFRLRCGFTGRRWLVDQDAHFRWCLSAPRELAQAENQAREEQLGHCPGAGPTVFEPPPPPPPFEPAPPVAEGPERCREYARVAVALSQENLRLGCGFTGRRWLVDQDAHFRWCLSAPRELTQAENQAREEQLGHCPRPRPPAIEPPPAPPFVPVAPIEPPPPGRPEPPPPVFPAWPVAPPPPPPPPPPGRPEPPPVFPAWPIAPPPPPPPVRPVPPPPPPPVPVYPARPIPPPPAKPAPPPIPVYPAQPIRPAPVIE